MAVYPQVVLSPDAIYLQAETYSAQDDRRDRQEAVWPGVYGANDFKISFVSGRTVRAATGVAYVKGRNVADQGFYRQTTTTTFDVIHNAGDASNPRVDQVIMRVMDNSHDSAGFNETRIEAVPGTPTVGATLDNRSGAINLDTSLGEGSKNYLLLADVLVPAGATTLVGTNIIDRRVFCVQGIPPLLTEIDSVPLIPSSGSIAVFGGMDNNAAEIIHGNHDLRQAYYLASLPRKITATKIRWRYVQDSIVAITGNYRIAIYDASGYKILDTGGSGTAFTGAVSSHQERVETIPSTTFDPGLYYVGIGVDTGAGSCRFPGINVSVSASVDNYIVGAISRNICLYSLTGGITMPATLLTGITDSGGQLTAAAAPGVPMVVLSDV
jgi:hypothetical protein